MEDTNSVFIMGYEVESVLGEGGFGLVVRAFKPYSNEEVAIKIVKIERGLDSRWIEDKIKAGKNEVDESKIEDMAKLKIRANAMYNQKFVQREIEFLKSVNHPNLPKLKEAFETDAHCIIVQEFIRGVNLHYLLHYNRIQKIGINEAGIKAIFAQLINAVRYLHEMGISHRDIKPENIIITMEGEDNLNGLRVVLVDLGLANRFSKSEENLFTFCGTPNYMAPEVDIMPDYNTVFDDNVNTRLTRPYSGDAVDVWSCGIVLYEMFTGELPFNFNPNDKGFQWSSYQDLRFADGMDSDAVDLIKKMLEPLPQHRCKMEDIINHPWLRDQASLLKKPFKTEQLNPSFTPGIERHQEMIDEPSIRNMPCINVEEVWDLYKKCERFLQGPRANMLPGKPYVMRNHSEFMNYLTLKAKNEINTLLNDEDLKKGVLQDINQTPIHCNSEKEDHNPFRTPVAPPKKRKSKHANLKSKIPMPVNRNPENIHENGANNDIHQVSGTNENEKSDERSEIANDNLLQQSGVVELNQLTDNNAKQNETSVNPPLQALAASSESSGNSSSKRESLESKIEVDLEEQQSNNTSPSNHSSDDSSDDSSDGSSDSSSGGSSDIYHLKVPSNNPVPNSRLPTTMDRTTLTSLDNETKSVQNKLNEMGIFTNKISKRKIECIQLHPNNESTLSFFERLVMAVSILISGKHDLGKEMRFVVKLKKRGYTPDYPVFFKLTFGNKKVFKELRTSFFERTNYRRFFRC